MSENLFDNENLTFLVLRNQQGQHSLWPEILQIPDGWQLVFGPQPRKTCLDWLNENWTDLRPKALTEME